jgi:hypothetical protein
MQFDSWATFFAYGKMVADDVFNKTPVKFTWMCSINTTLEDFLFVHQLIDYFFQKHLNICHPR